MFFLCELYWQFCWDVNQEDISTIKTFEINDAKIEILEAEARILAYLALGCDIKVAYLGNVMIGFLIYQKIFETMITVRCLYVDSIASQLKLGKGLISSLWPIPKQLIFQTRKGLPPDRCLEVTKGFRTKISEDEHFETWLMDWRT